MLYKLGSDVDMDIGVCLKTEKDVDVIPERSLNQNGERKSRPVRALQTA